VSAAAVGTLTQIQGSPGDQGGQWNASGGERGARVDVALMETTDSKHLAVYTVAEVAALLRCDPRTVRRSIEQGQIPCVRIANTLRVPASAMDQILRLGQSASGDFEFSDSVRAAQGLAIGNEGER
jgi:excisionase family DNA binding protein